MCLSGTSAREGKFDPNKSGDGMSIASQKKRKDKLYEVEDRVGFKSWEVLHWRELA